MQAGARAHTGGGGRRGIDAAIGARGRDASRTGAGLRFAGGHVAVVGVDVDVSARLHLSVGAHRGLRRLVELDRDVREAEAAQQGSRQRTRVAMGIAEHGALEVEISA